MSIVAQTIHVAHCRNIVDQSGVFASGRSIHTAVKECVKMTNFLKEGCHMGGVPHEASSRVFYGEKDSCNRHTSDKVPGFFDTGGLRKLLWLHGAHLNTAVHCVKLCTAKLCLENQNKTYRDQSYPKAFPQINKRESNFPCSLAQITPDNKQRFNTHSVSLARA